MGVATPKVPGVVAKPPFGAQGTATPIFFKIKNLIKLMMMRPLISSVKFSLVYMDFY
jgi:hypothetical protein